MRKSAVPEMDVAWWRKNQASGLSSAKELDKALEAHAKALQSLQRSRAEDHQSECLKALDAVEQAVKKVRDEAAKTLKNPPKGQFDAEDMRNTADALDRYERPIAAAREVAEGLVDEATGTFDNPDNYAAYLKGALQKAKQGPMQFALGAGSSPSAHRIAMHRTTSGASLTSMLRKQTDLKKFCYGIAGADAAKPTTLVLHLESAALPGLKNKLQMLRKQFGPFPFDHFAVMINGAEVDDMPDPEDAPMPATTPASVTSAATSARGSSASPAPSSPADAELEPLRGALKRLMPDITAAMVANPGGRPQLMAQVGAAKSHLAAGRVAEGRAAIDALRVLLAGQSRPASSPDAGAPNGAALAAWQSARTAAVAQLNALGAAIAASKDAQARAALIQLKAISANLAPSPGNAQNVLEIERYLSTDDVIADVESPNPFGLKVDLRAPLLGALQSLKAEMAR